MGKSADPLHIVCEAGVAIALGMGLTTTDVLIAVPEQPLPAGVRVKVTVAGAFVVLVNDPLILPAPLLPMPVTEPILSLDQLNTVPGTLLLNTIMFIADPLHIVCVLLAMTAVGIGLTTTAAVMGAPFGQPETVGIIVKITVTGTLDVLVNLPLISPLPEAAMPVMVPLAWVPLFLVHWYTVPFTLPVNLMAVMSAPLQMVCAIGVATALGIGFTVIFPEVTAFPHPPVKDTL